MIYRQNFNAANIWEEAALKSDWLSYSLFQALFVTTVHRDTTNPRELLPVTIWGTFSVPQNYFFFFKTIFPMQI